MILVVTRGYTEKRRSWQVNFCSFVKNALKYVMQFHGHLGISLNLLWRIHTVSDRAVPILFCNFQSKTHSLNKV
jgi:hypothetical protein